MNIFYVDRDPVKCAEYMVDRHITKMVLETAQLLSTAHRILDGTEEYVKGSNGKRKRVWRLTDPDKDATLYQVTHFNHPSAVWVRRSNNNYNWLYCHFVALLDEYTYRYGKVHKCASLCKYLWTPPHNIPVYYLTPMALAMPDEFKVASDVESYRNYYRNSKKHLHKWTKRPIPEWITA